MACILATRSDLARLRRIAYRRPVAGLRIVDNPKKDRYEARDGMLSSGMDVGVNEGYARLDAMVANGAI